MESIDLSTPEAQDRVAAGARRKPSGRAGGVRLQGAELRQAILDMKAEGKTQGDAAREYDVTKQYVSKVWSTTDAGADRLMGRPALQGPIPADVLERMCTKLRTGEVERRPGARGAAPSVDLLDVPGVAECFPVPGVTEPEQVRQRQRNRIRQMIHQGQHAAEGSQARALYDARQEGLLRREVAA